MLKTCKDAIARSDLGNCEPLGLSLADWAAIIGLIIVILGGLKYLGPAVPRLFGWTSNGKIRSFRGLKKAVRPLVRDNKRIFRAFGPKSGAADNGLEKFDVAAWHQARLNIRANNEVILSLLKQHTDLIPAEHQTLFSRWVDHIQAFSAHLEDSSVDYRHHQYPSQIDDVLNI